MKVKELGNPEHSEKMLENGITEKNSAVEVMDPRQNSD